MCDFLVWNKDTETWEGVAFASADFAEDYILEHGGYEHYDIFEKLT